MNRARQRQQGSFLLEALIAILIVALGVLGSVGLLARSMQEVDDAKNRGEAAYLANQLIGQMWLTDRVTATLDTEYSSALGSGVGYTDFKTRVEQRLPNADKYTQDVIVAAGPIPGNPASSVVTVRIYWCPPGEYLPAGCGGSAALESRHRYDITASIGAN
jgi:type IV pilus assembly protein PilV